MDVELLTFTTTEQFVVWAQRVIKYKFQRYDRPPSAPTALIFGDGHTHEMDWGKRRGTVLANLKYEVGLICGKLPGKNLLAEITERRGVSIQFTFDE